MAGVLFIIWIPSEKFEECLRNNRVWGATENSVVPIKQQFDSDYEVTINTKEKKPPSGDTIEINIEPDSIETAASKNLIPKVILHTRSYENITPSAIMPNIVKRSWENFRDFPSSEKKEDEEKLENFDDHPSMEKIMKEIIERTKIQNVAWVEMNGGNSLEITFTLESGPQCDDTIHMLSEWGIGQREDSSISIIPCTLYYKPNQKPEQEQQEIINLDVLSLKDTAWNKFISSVRSRLNVAKIVDEVTKDATLTFDFIILLIVAGILAAFGLVEDSTFFLTASMLISPLMGPIIAATFGTVIKDRKLQFIGVTNELIGIAIATLVGFFFGLIVCSVDVRYGIGEGISNEMLSRCELHSLVVGILIALPSGAAVAIAILGENVGSLVGVAISASLLPPAVNAGLLWALSCVYMIFVEDGTKYNSIIKTNFYSDHQSVELAILGCISMCVTLSNVICIYVMGVLFLKIKEVAPIASRNQRQFWKHDIKIARDYNKTLHSEKDLPLKKKIAEEIAEFNGLQDEPFRGVGAELLKSHETWSPMTHHKQNGFRRESCPVRDRRTSIYDLDALYITSITGQQIHDKSRFTAIPVSFLKNNSQSPPNNSLPDDVNNLFRKSSVPQDVVYSNRHSVYPSSSSAPLEKIDELRSPFVPATESQDGPTVSRRKFVVTPALDPLDFSLNSS